ncbi:MAG: translation initiation factor [Patescibacteria group bacterium]|nr:translation initiation factor [Patescibacteria group bacterium]
MNQKQELKLIGTITESLPNAMFRVLLDGQENTMIAYLSGKMRKFKIKVLIGDKVEVIIDPYGGKGRIARRM